MNEWFCFYTHTVCKEGYPGLKDQQCIMWDEQKGVCLMRENSKYILEQFRIQAELRDKSQAQILLKDLNLLGGRIK